MSDPTPPKRPGNPNMKKGAPSVNPSGVAKRKAPGSDGVVALGGYLFNTGERNAALTGSNKWVTYDNTLANVAIVATAVRIWLALAGSVKWKAVENPRGGADAKKCAELVHDGLLTAQMTRPWRNVVKRQMMKVFRGFAMHAKGTRRAGDGRIVFAELAHRPQWTIDQWVKPEETAPWEAVVQRTKLGQAYTINRSDLFYSAEDAIGDSPDGVGLFRHLAETEKAFTRYRQIQGIAFDNDVNGVPLGRAPLSELAKLGAKVLNTTDESAIKAWVDTQTSFLRDLLENRVVKSNRSLLLDSLPYFSAEVDGTERPSQTFQWSYDTIKSQVGSIPELRHSLDDLNKEFARVMCMEWILMGDSEGARAVSDSKMRMSCLVINGALDDLADDGTRDLSWWLTARNGYDPEKFAPTLEHEPVDTKTALEVAEMLATLAKAALAPGDEAVDMLRQRENLPPAAEFDDADLMAPRGQPKKKAADDKKPTEDDPEDKGED